MAAARKIRGASSLARLLHNNSNLIPQQTFLRTPSSQTSHPSQQQQLPKFPRHFSSSPPSTSSSNFSMLKSEEEFNNSIAQAQDDRVPSVFYFTAVWCGPCRLVAPIIEELSKNYHHVKIYKIDVDQPTFHFFQNGKKASEMTGADVALLRQTMAELYK
ncbi:hypothetical protein IFM89_010754 [Coptis chinensis]|uniref:Thioredoxin domain-containing protein n=1 Tax=Coptis chinensis TaxID=261450 RepID=A0A835IMQ7_9MAGN|nr:hypothetical protein IFM89_010754 [Coptis chinensis]